jgi:hypothetical protein
VELDPSTISVVSGVVGTVLGGAVAEFYRRVRGRAKPGPTAQEESGPPDSGVHAAPEVSKQEALTRIRIERIFKWTQTETEHRAHDQIARQTTVQTAEAVQAIAIGMDRMREDENARERRLMTRLDRLEERVVREHGISIDALLAELRSRRE